ncbi:unnamed protein product [Ectocarpus sp. 6 AP-2014]
MSPMVPGTRLHRAKRRRACRTTFLAAVVLAVAVLCRQPAVAAAGAVATAERKDDVVLAAATLAAFQERKAGVEERTSPGASNIKLRLRETQKTTSTPVRRVPTTLEHLVAGTVGGVSGALVSYPLDTVRVRMQTCGKTLGVAGTASMLFQEAGVAGFYRGVLSPMVGTGIIKAAVFGGYGLCQALVRRGTGKDNEELNLVDLGVAAMGSGLVGSFVVTPVERIKVVMQAALSSSPSASSSVAARAGGGYANAWGCARGLVAEHGLRGGLYAGLGPTLLREVPGYAFYFATYEACKRVLLGNGSGEDSSRGPVLLKTAVSGALAGIAAWLPTYPADVVKSRMQSAGGSGAGMISTASVMWKTEGLAPFYRGLSPTIVRAMVNHAATFLVYEASMSFIMRRGRRGEVASSEEKDRS